MRPPATIRRQLNLITQAYNTGMESPYGHTRALDVAIQEDPYNYRAHFGIRTPEVSYKTVRLHEQTLDVLGRFIWTKELDRKSRMSLRTVGIKDMPTWRFNVLPDTSREEWQRTVKDQTIVLATMKWRKLPASMCLPYLRLEMRLDELMELWQGERAAKEPTITLQDFRALLQLVHLPEKHILNTEKMMLKRGEKVFSNGDDLPCAVNPSFKGV